MIGVERFGDRESEYLSVCHKPLTNNDFNTINDFFVALIFLSRPIMIGRHQVQ